MAMQPDSGRSSPGDQPQGRGLAGTGRAEQDDELAVGDRQAEIADRDEARRTAC